MPDWNAATATAEAIACGWADAPGGAILIFGRDGIRAGAAGGFASLEHRLPFTATTPSRYASISKHFLAATLLLEGADLTAPLGTLLKGLSPAIGAVPLGRALDMSGAIPDVMELLWQQGVPFTASLKPEEAFGILTRATATCAPPGTEMAYSNSGWRLAQRVLPDYPAALRRHLLDPLDLPIAFPLDEAEIVPGLATGYWREGETWRRGRYGMHFSASGGLAGSAEALARWGAALLAGRGPLDGMLERLAAPRAFADGTPSAYRLGLVETALGGTRLLVHGGSLPGYRNHLLMAPDQGVGVVLLSNREEEALWPALRVMAALLGETMPCPAANPTGLYAEADGPFWAELTPGAISTMGGYEALVEDVPAEDVPGGFRSLPAYLDIRLRVAADGALEGRIGGAPRRLLPVPAGLAPDPRLAGRWRDDAFGTEITIRPDGTARFPWAGGIGTETTLTPLPGGRALASLTHGPWRHRPCLWLEGETLRMASHRARILQFRRQEGTRP